jgi:hypothetical protein
VLQLINFQRSVQTLATWGNGAVRTQLTSDVTVSFDGFAPTGSATVDGIAWPTAIALTTVGRGDRSGIYMVKTLATAEFDDQGTYLGQTALQYAWYAPVMAFAFTGSAVPEPGMLALFGLGAMGLGVRRRRAA